jgi:pyruvate-ferredoxin/flavodoxin oxidoreductase
VLDTQVYSNTGGQACTSGFHGQISDMAYFGPAQHGKTEHRKELGLVTIAHRETFLLQSSQASGSHLLEGVLRGIASRHPAVFNIYAPCQPEHGLADDQSFDAAKTALECRAFPFIIYDPDAGESIAERIDLSGNPDIDKKWTEYEIEYAGGNGKQEKQTMTLPLTVADWAATEARFGKHFKKVSDKDPDEALTPFHEFLEFPAEERTGRIPFIYAVDNKERLIRMKVSSEIVELAEDRLSHWAHIKELGGVELSRPAHDRVAQSVGKESEERIAALKSEYEERIAQADRVIVERLMSRLADAVNPTGK